MLNKFDQSKAIKAGLRKGFTNGESKIANRKCYGYDATPDGDLVINPEETKSVLGKIATDLERRGILAPTNRPKWNQEAIDKLISNEKYTELYLDVQNEKQSRFKTQKTGLH